MVFEDDLAVAFLDICPVNPGHTLVVPRRHVISFEALTPDEIQAVMLSTSFPDAAVMGSVCDYRLDTLRMRDARRWM